MQAVLLPKLMARVTSLPALQQAHTTRRTLCLQGGLVVFVVVRQFESGLVLMALTSTRQCFGVQGQCTQHLLPARHTLLAS